MQARPRISGALRVSVSRVKIKGLLGTAAVALEGEEGAGEGVKVVVARVVDGDVENITLIYLADVEGRQERLVDNVIGNVHYAPIRTSSGSMTLVGGGMVALGRCLTGCRADPLN